LPHQLETRKVDRILVSSKHSRGGAKANIALPDSRKLVTHDHFYEQTQQSRHGNIPDKREPIKRIDLTETTLSYDVIQLL